MTVAVLTAGCSSGTVASTDYSPDQVLRFPIEHDVDSLDPALIDNERDRDIAQNVFNGLLKVDDVSLNAVPDIAQALPEVSSDGLTYTFHLRDDAQFSNGDAVTASDFVYSWSRAVALHAAASRLFSDVAGYGALTAPGAQGELGGLHAISDTTLKVDLQRPRTDFLARIAQVGAAAVDRKVIATGADVYGRGAKRGDDWASKPATLIGTGPYRMSARAPGQTLEFETVPHWWGTPKPIIRHVVISVLGDINTALSAYDTGSFDLVGYGGARTLPQDVVVRKARSTPDEVHANERAGSTWIGFNYQSGPFAGAGKFARDLRLAFSLAIDRQALEDAVCARRSLCVAASDDLIPTGLERGGESAAGSISGFEVDAARVALRGADPDGTKTASLQFAFADDADGRALAATLQNQWQTSLGVRVRTKAVPPATFPMRRDAGEFTLFEASFEAPYNAPAVWYENLFVSGAPHNGGGFEDPRVDLQVEGAARQSGVTAPYESVAALLVDDVAYAPLYYSTGVLISKPYLQGVGQNNLSDYHWAKASVLDH